VYGAPWPEELTEPAQYAGCAVGCCENACDGWPDTTACAVNAQGACWTLYSLPEPVGWDVLSLVDGCDAFTQCGN
jgi:hypothetical protein